MKSGKLKRIYNYLDRFIVVPLAIIIVVQAIWFFTTVGFDPDIPEAAAMIRFIAIVCVAIMVLYYYSMVRINSVHDPAFRQRYAERRAETRSIKGRLSLVLGWKRFYIELAAMTGVFAILPPKVFSGLCYILGADNPNLRLYYLICVPSAVILLGFLARLGAIRSFKYGGYEQTTFNNEKAADKAYEKNMIRATIAYAGGGAALCFVVPLLLTFLPILRELATVGNIILLIVIILFPFTLRIVKAILKRRKFLKGLKKVCGSKGYTLSKIAKPYRSIFSVPGGESFTITAADGKGYSCQFIGALRKSDPLVIREKGTATFIHTVRILKVEVLNHYKECDFAYESEQQRILILNPVPKKVYTIQKGQSVELDNGDSVGEYKIFTGTAFINALERDSVDRKV